MMFSSHGSQVYNSLKNHTTRMEFYVEANQPPKSIFELKKNDILPDETLAITEARWTWTNGSEQKSGSVGK